MTELSNANPNQNQKPTKTRVNGVILIDKPKGLSAQQVVAKVKYLFMSPEHNSKKAGHTGTLDPMATGLLPICMGEATKFSHYQLDADKSYEAIIQLGQQTSTGDTEGEVIITAPIPSLTESGLQDICQQFMGDIMQVPPMYSAIKKNGKKLYEYARAGQQIEREARQISIKTLTLTAMGANQIKLTVTCSKGTYIRVLGEDIAQALGTVGHLIQLRRTGVDKFDIREAISLDDFEALTFQHRFKRLLPIDVCLGDMPILQLDDNQVQRIRNGQRLNLSQKVDPSWFHHSDDQTARRDIRLYAADNNCFVGLASIEKGGRLQPTKVLNL